MAKKKTKKTAETPKQREKPDTAVFRFYSALIESLRWETLSPEGHVNLAVDILLATIIIAYLVTSTPTSMARIIVSIFNPNLTTEAGDNIITLVLIFIGAALLCLLVMFFTRKETKPFRKDAEDDE